MLLVAPVQRIASSAEALAEQARVDGEDPDSAASGCGCRRSTIPAVTHVDYSARVQTVDERRHRRFYRLLKTFHARPAAPCSSTRASTSAASPSSARRRRVPLFPRHRHGRARARRHDPREGRRRPRR